MSMTEIILSSCFIVKQYIQNAWFDANEAINVRMHCYKCGIPIICSNAEGLWASLNLLPG